MIEIASTQNLETLCSKWGLIDTTTLRDLVGYSTH